MTQPKHTPTPYQRSYFVDSPKYNHMGDDWKKARDAEERLNIRGPRRVGDGSCNVVARVWNEDDAEFIVRACNAHDDLVAALEKLKNADLRLPVWAMKWINKALAKAKAGA